MFARTHSALITGSIMAVMLFSVSAQAQITRENVPSSVQPGRVGNQIQRPAVDLDVETPSAPAAPSLVMPANARDVSFTLKDVTFEGLTAYDKEELAVYYKNQIGQTQTLADVYVLADLLTLKMRKDGFLVSTVAVPAQEITDGVVKLAVVEGHVSNVMVEFDEEAKISEDGKAFVTKIAKKIEGVKPLSAKTLERYLLLINDLPGISASSVIQASASVPAGADLTINVTQKKVEGFLQADNRGTRFLGPIQGQAGLYINGALTDFGQLGFRVSKSYQPSELGFFEVSHLSALNAEGLKLALTASVNKTQPGHTLKSFDIESVENSLSAELRYPLIRGRQENLQVYGKFTHRDVSTDSLLTLVSEDRLRVLSAGADYTKSDGWMKGGSSSLSVSVSHGLDILDASEATDANLTRAEGEPNFVKFNASASRVQNLGGTWSVLAAVDGQYTDDPLLASEEFGVGGAAFGGAYDPSEITGDVGAAAKLEVRYDGFTEELEHLDSYQAFAYVDAGYTRDLDKLAGQRSHRTLMSAGFGSRFFMPNNVSGSVEVAKPLTRNVSALGDDGDDVRVFFTLAKQF